MAKKVLTGLDLNGPLTIAGSGGTNGYFLKTDGSGNVSWASESAGLAASNYVAQGKLAADQSVASATNDVLISFVDDFDPQNWWDATAKRFTPTVAGYYNIALHAWWTAAGTTTNQYNIQIRKNASTFAIFQNQTVTGSGLSQGGSRVVYLNGSTDYVDFTAYNGDTTSRSLQWGGAGQGTWFSAALITSGVIGNKNYIINGAFDVAQRGSSPSGAFTANTTSNSAYGLDQWVVTAPGTLASTITVSMVQTASTANMITGYDYPYYAVLNSGASGTASSGTVMSLSQRIEDVRTLAGQTVTLSFWAKAAANNSNFVPVIEQVFGTGGSARVTNTGSALSITTSWQRFTYTVTLGSMSGKTIASDSYLNIIPLQLPGANWSNNLSISIAGVKLEASAAASSFSRLGASLAEEVVACQRYYWRLPSASVIVPVSNGAYYTTTACYTVIRMPVSMRSAPTFSINDAAGLTVYALGANKASSAVAGGNISKDAVELNITTTAVATNGAAAFIRFLANASAYIEFTAEL